MKILSPKVNNKNKAFELKTSAKTYFFPYVKAKPTPTAKVPVTRVYADKEIGAEKGHFTFRFGSQDVLWVESLLLDTKKQMSDFSPVTGN